MWTRVAVAEIKAEEVCKRKNRTPSANILGRGPKWVVVALVAHATVSLECNIVKGPSRDALIVAAPGQMCNCPASGALFPTYSVSLLTPCEFHDVILLLKDPMELSLCSQQLLANFLILKHLLRVQMPTQINTMRSQPSPPLTPYHHTNKCRAPFARFQFPASSKIASY